MISKNKPIPLTHWSLGASGTWMEMDRQMAATKLRLFRRLGTLVKQGQRGVYQLICGADSYILRTRGFK